MKYSYPIRTVYELRDDFWREHRHLVCRRNERTGTPLSQNHQPADTRAAFVYYVDQLARCGRLSNRLANSATL